MNKDPLALTGLRRQVLEQIVNTCSDGIVLVDAQSGDLPVLYVNPAYTTLTGYSAEELVGGPWPMLEEAGREQPEVRRLKTALGRAQPCEVTVPAARRDGSVWFSQVSTEPLYGAGGELQYFLCRERPAPPASNSTVDLRLLQRELGRARQAIASMSRTDPATGLLRLDVFAEMMRRDMAMARREQRPMALMLFEVVELDVYSRTFGAKAAESCLRMIAAQISGTLRRASDLCARGEGEDLIAVVSGQDRAEALVLADRIAQNVRRLGLHNPRACSGHYVAVRVGLAACLPGPDDTFESLLRSARADLTLPRVEPPKKAAF